MALRSPTYPVGVPWLPKPAPETAPDATSTGEAPNIWNDPNYVNNLTPATANPTPWMAPWAGQSAFPQPQPNVWNTPNYVATLTGQPPQQPPAFTSAPAPSLISPVSPSYPTGGYNVNQAMLTARNNSLDASGRVIDASGRTLDASGRVTAAQRGTLPAQYAVLGARRGVVDAQGRQIQSQRDYTAAEEQANNQREADRQAVLNARNNTADQAAVAEAKNFRANMDQNYSLFGVKPPTDVINRDGATLPPGTRGALQTQEDIVSEHAQDAEGARKTKLETARLATAWAGLDVSEKQNIAAQYGLTLDEAEMKVKEAQYDEADARLGESRAALDSRRASLDEQQIGTPPYAGAERYTNPATGEGTWLTPAEAANRRTQDQANLRPARENDNPATKYSESELGAFSEAELYRGIGTSFTPQQVQSELVKRGLTPQQAEIKVREGTPTNANPTTRYSPSSTLGAFTSSYLLNFIGLQNSPLSEAEIMAELTRPDRADRMTEGQARIAIQQEKLRKAPSTPQLEPYVDPADGKTKFRIKQ